MPDDTYFIRDEYQVNLVLAAEVQPKRLVSRDTSGDNKAKLPASTGDPVTGWTLMGGAAGARVAVTRAGTPAIVSVLVQDAGGLAVGDPIAAKTDGTVQKATSGHNIIAYAREAAANNTTIHLELLPESNQVEVVP